jgi:hypothetical protein
MLVACRIRGESARNVSRTRDLAYKAAQPKASLGVGKARSCESPPLRRHRSGGDMHVAAGHIAKLDVRPGAVGWLRG